MSFFFVFSPCVLRSIQTCLNYLLQFFPIIVCCYSLKQRILNGSFYQKQSGNLSPGNQTVSRIVITNKSSLQTDSAGAQLSMKPRAEGQIVLFSLKETLFPVHPRLPMHAFDTYPVTIIGLRVNDTSFSGTSLACAPPPSIRTLRLVIAVLNHAAV